MLELTILNGEPVSGYSTNSTKGDCLNREDGEHRVSEKDSGESSSEILEHTIPAVNDDTERYNKAGSDNGPIVIKAEQFFDQVAGDSEGDEDRENNLCSGGLADCEADFLVGNDRVPC